MSGGAEPGTGSEPSDGADNQTPTRLPFWIAETLLVFVDAIALVPSGIIVRACLPISFSLSLSQARLISRLMSNFQICVCTRFDMCSTPPGIARRTDTEPVRSSPPRPFVPTTALGGVAGLVVSVIALHTLPEWLLFSPIHGLSACAAVVHVPVTVLGAWLAARVTGRMEEWWAYEET